MKTRLPEPSTHLGSLTAFLLLFSCSFSWGQEALKPLGVDVNRPLGPMGVHRSTNALDSTYQYASDTLDIPLFDDFAVDKFQKYPTDPAVAASDTLYHALLDSLTMNPLAAGTCVNFDPALRFTIDTTSSGTDTLVVDTLQAGYVYYSDLSVWPVDYSLVKVYPGYSIYDTVYWAGPNDTVINVIDTVFLTLTDCQDSARVFFVNIDDSAAIWVDTLAYRNLTYAVEPLSLGVATLDCVDANGFPYDFGMSTSYGEGDHLTSKPIFLNYAANDSIALTFYYQAGGFGDEPESADSLLVDFWSPDSSKWYNVWGIEGMDLDTFRRAHVPVIQQTFLKDGFRFRFRVKGERVGVLDLWHIDWVELKQNSSFSIPGIPDVALYYPWNTLLQDFTAVPWEHYKNSPSGRMSTSTILNIRNLLNVAVLNQDGNVDIFESGSLDGSFTVASGLVTDGDPNFLAEKIYASDLDISSFGYAYPTTPSGDSAVFTVMGDFPSATEFDTNNNVTKFDQRFENYYAYDDGSAEQIWELTGAQAEVAYKFTAYQTDTLVGVKIKFIPSVDDVTDKTFLITVWDDASGVPGNILFQQDFFNGSNPSYAPVREEFRQYILPDSNWVALPQTFYVGWRQIAPDPLNVGFDRNTNQQDKLFFNVGSGWFNTSFQGSLMMRPIISTALNYQLGVETPVMPEVVAYPNPVSHELRLQGAERYDSFMFMDMSGRILLKGAPSEVMDVSGLSDGVYLVRLLGDAGHGETHKIIVQH